MKPKLQKDFEIHVEFKKALTHSGTFVRALLIVYPQEKINHCAVKALTEGHVEDPEHLKVVINGLIEEVFSHYIRFQTDEAFRKETLEQVEKAQEEDIKEFLENVKKIEAGSSNGRAPDFDSGG